ncbi:hypothetical protein CcaverHIS002_0601760 [Cutaneotrichosporon cavernicola]|uniref:RRM domain-containing protein n=1 Tax=Cutaneotrichosporon cavernicola TaxID=279322 RepID=A0AA48L5Y8_9TREE|nr:uncharacterized protein CcaverHIS019_0501860 [Cutaneotrichosporon cavernicola]BEI85889.1 hypothetical protein CcaverHIS002_0601760 [Cutaneotrichosporon cavernicola]BEI92558.1 hypothetical protein CcaverHIS019_0501860 [Cutaneotrichosporon cavernicola]BEJ00331.1 hypothetical protein CcaverHIS631_0501880 [Cutaneotrichosporon cavernicola]BEJ08101.1 hypothetical protein CcaverHIS641_0501860 [Cutaneotrichosporon cavernicola]
MAYATPSPTLFVGNLETKTKKPELRSQLYALFTPYGRVIDVVAKKHNGGRGQAFIVFDEVASATAALRALSGEMFYERSLNLAYSRTSSHATLALDDPTFSKEAIAIKAARGVLDTARGEYEQLASEKRPLEEPEERTAKRAKIEDEDDMEIEMEDDEDVTGEGIAVMCTNLPAECNEDIMAALFSQYPGFTRAVTFTGQVPTSHPPPNAEAKSFRVLFGSRAEAEAAVAPLNGYLMQPGWEMAVSVQA